MADRNPNILFVMADQLAAPALPIYGNNKVIAPNLERLANEGVVFENAYCNLPMCAPSRASMHYGRYPFRSGVYEFEYHNNNAEHCQPTLPEQMVTLGYQFEKNN